MNALPEATPCPRADTWKRKLLDLSLRNRLLNHRETASVVPVMCAAPDKLEDALANGHSFALQPQLPPPSPAPGQRAPAPEAIQAWLEKIHKAREKKRLHCALDEPTTAKRLLKLFRSARTTLEETGANSLFLAVGFLHWYETPTSDKERKAPILLLPVELNRENARAGFTLRSGDDDTSINVTLVQKLKTDFDIDLPGLDPLPEDDAGVHVLQILQHVRAAVDHLPRWHVEPDVALASYTFSKFVLWRDLDASVATLMSSPVVAHLCTKPQEPFTDGGDFPKASLLDDTVPSAQVFCPMDADSTQLSAVLAAAQGRSFVLEGPPGTGKSQTITNLISHALGQGKSVLFVSQKRAALEVVHERLQRVGLGDFALELHSNKARKKRVLEELGRVLDMAPQLAHRRPNDTWDQTATQLDQVRAQLNGYVRALHEPGTAGLTAFRAISVLSGLRNAETVPITERLVATTDAATLAELRTMVDDLARSAEAVSPLAQHPFRAVRCKRWEPGMDQQVSSTAQRIALQAETLVKKAHDLSAVWPIDIAAMRREQIPVLLSICEQIRQPRLELISALAAPSWQQAHTTLQAWISAGTAVSRADAYVRAVFHPQRLMAFDLVSLRERFDTWANAFFLLAWIMLVFARRRLRTAATGSLPPSPQLVPYLDAGITLQQQQGSYAVLSTQIPPQVLQRAPQNDNGWAQMQASLDWVANLHELVTRFDELGELPPGGTAGATASFLQSHGQAIASTTSAEHQAIAAIQQGLIELTAGVDQLRDALTVDEHQAWRPSESGWLHNLRDTLQQWRTALTSLRPWILWRVTHDRALEAGLDGVVLALEEGHLAPDELRPAFERSFHERWLAIRFGQRPELRDFQGPVHDGRLEHFRATDQAMLAQTSPEIIGKLAALLPSSTAGGAGRGEVGVLRRELRKKRRHMSLRKLFQKTPTLLRHLKPCLLMSPLSVAQYVPPELAGFDLVVFDEASQMPTWEAIGAIARARSAVIVGDSKQLPPTNFFSAGDHDDEPVDEDEIVELESILDETAACLPRMNLGWHYRSRHESLIAFSNHRYYEDRLQVFPSPVRNTDNLGVVWRPVPDGVYDKSRTRTNQREAEQIVAEVRKRLEDKTTSDASWESLGIVTFSKAQQLLIEDMLETLRQQNPSIDAFFGEQVEEPVFVKNLENVQGDERDVILFSICYGPDAEGKVSMNFGPLNRDGGERRLNVAVTRARRALLVFSTLTPDMIDTNRTKARGAHHLRAFLSYAQKGPAHMEAEREAPEGTREESIASNVAAYVRKAGWHVDQRVGVASYRLDLAVADPKRPERYLLGIEIDGPVYRDANNTRDRDRIRGAVLEGLGWQLTRIWSPEWWHDPEGQTKRLLQLLTEASTDASTEATEQHSVPTEESAATSSPSAPSRLGPKGTLIMPAQQPDVPSSSSTEKEPVPDTAAPPTVEPLGEAAPDGPLEHHAEASRTGGLTPESELYKATVIQAYTNDQNRFYEASDLERLLAVVCQVVAAEGPIHVQLLARRVSGACGIDRLSRRVQKRTVQLARASGAACGTMFVGDFLWPADTDPKRYRKVRLPASEDDEREINYIALEELGNVIQAILRAQMGMSEKDLIAETAKMLGYGRAGRVIRERLQQAITLLERQQRCLRQADDYIAIGPIP